MVTTSSTSLTFFITLTTKLTERLINTALDDLEATGKRRASGGCRTLTPVWLPHQMVSWVLLIFLFKTAIQTMLPCHVIHVLTTDNTF